MSLNEALANAMLDLRDWTADGKHQQGYSYITSDAVLTRVGRALGENNIIIMPEITDEGVVEVEGATQRGGSRFDAVVRFQMHIFGEGETRTAAWVGRGSDFTAADKATYKAITSGHKYFLMKLLNIGVGNEDGEHDVVEAGNHPVRRQNTSKPQAPRQPTPPQPPAQARPVDEVTGWLRIKAGDGDNAPSDKQLKFARTSLLKAVSNDADAAGRVLYSVFGLASSKDLTAGQASAIIDWLGATAETAFMPLPSSAQEADSIATAFGNEAGLFPEDARPNNYPTD